MIKKWVKRILLCAILIILAIYFYGLYTSSQKWKDYYSDKDVVDIITIINNSKSLPQNIYVVYDSLFPACRYRTMYDDYNSLLGDLFIRKRELNRCGSSFFQRAYYDFPSNIRNRKIEYAPWFFGWLLSRNTSVQKCFDFNMANINLTKNGIPLKGIEEISMYTYHKNLSDLSRTEIESLFLQMRL